MLARLFGGAASSAEAAAPSAAPAAAAATDAASFLRTIVERRAVFPKDMRRGAEVPRAKLERMLEAARWAPTHKMTQPWRFVCLLGDEHRRAFEELSIDLVAKKEPDEARREATLKKMRRKQENDWRNVGCYVAIAMRRTQSAGAPPEWEEAASVAMAVQNLWLAGWSEGVHGYWSSWQPAARDAPEMLDFLGLDARTDKVMGFFVAGVADPERLAAYRGSRSVKLDECVEWRL